MVDTIYPRRSVNNGKISQRREDKRVKGVIVKVEDDDRSANGFSQACCDEGETVVF